MSTLLTKAAEFYREGYFTEAKICYEQANGLQPENSKVLEVLGTLALWANNTDEAISYLQRAYQHRGWWSRRWPLDSQLSNRMALAYYRKDDYANAARWYARAAGPWSIRPFKQLKVLQKQMEAFAGQTPYLILGPEVVDMPFLMLDPLPVVEVNVSGEGPFQFFIDTGGADVIVQTQLADELGIAVYGEITGDFAGGKKAPIGLGKLENLELGDTTINNLPVHVHPLTGIDDIFRRPIHGVIGTSLLRHFYPTIDYAGQKLVLRQLNESSARCVEALAQRNIRVPFWLIEMHMLVARGRINDLPPALFYVDTGLANRGFLVSKALLKAAGMSLDWSQAKQSTGGGGDILSVDFLNDTVALGEGMQQFTRHNVTASKHQGDLLIFKGNLGFNVSGLVSHDFFKDTSLTLDFQKMRLIL